MTVSLLYNTPLWVCAKAIRKCWASEDKSDTCDHIGGLIDLGDRWYCDICKKELNTPNIIITGLKDKALIERVGNQNKHKSVLEHICYSFDIDEISRACLQELARHRVASLSVKSTRYTLKELKTAKDYEMKQFLVSSNDEYVDRKNQVELTNVRDALQKGISNDKIKYLLPEAYKTSLVWTINARSLQNFLELRTSPHALQEIRNLAYKIYYVLPESHKYLFTEYLYKKLI